MGVESDREIAELICGSDKTFLELLAPSFEDVSKLDVHTQLQALEHIGGKMKAPMLSGRPFGARPMKRDPVAEAKDMLATTILAHVPVEEVNGQLNLRPKCVYVALMVRRCLQAVRDGGVVDDRDFVGNKRLEL